MLQGHGMPCPYNILQIGRTQDSPQQLTQFANNHKASNPNGKRGAGVG